MRFEESEKTISLKSLPDVFVYFLTRGDDVVYVGQTTCGISRPVSHKEEKDFDCIYILPCDAKDLNRLEGYYIDKYTPEYNARPNLKTHKSLKKAKEDISALLGLRGYTMRHMHKDIEMLGIVPTVYSGTEYITDDDEQRISWLHRCGNLNVEE